MEFFLPLFQFWCPKVEKWNKLFHFYSTFLPVLKKVEFCSCWTLSLGVAYMVLCLCLVAMFLEPEMTSIIEGEPPMLDTNVDTLCLDGDGSPVEASTRRRLSSKGPPAQKRQSEQSEKSKGKANEGKKKKRGQADHKEEKQGGEGEDKAGMIEEDEKVDKDDDIQGGTRPDDKDNDDVSTKGSKVDKDDESSGGTRQGDKTDEDSSGRTGESDDEGEDSDEIQAKPKAKAKTGKAKAKARSKPKAKSKKGGKGLIRDQSKSKKFMELWDQLPGELQQQFEELRRDDQTKWINQGIERNERGRLSLNTGVLFQLKAQREEVQKGKDKMDGYILEDLGISLLFSPLHRKPPKKTTTHQPP